MMMTKKQTISLCTVSRRWPTQLMPLQCLVVVAAVAVAVADDGGHIATTGHDTGSGMISFVDHRISSHHDYRHRYRSRQVGNV